MSMVEDILIRNFHTIKSILNFHRWERISTSVSYFHTIKSILNPITIWSALGIADHFHTIKSILNWDSNHLKKAKETVFPYY